MSLWWDDPRSSPIQDVINFADAIFKQGPNYQGDRAMNELDQAQSAFTITEDAQVVNVRYLSATADTGWRYSIVISDLPGDGAVLEGGPMLVTVTSPWQKCWAFQRTGYLYERYVVEHLCPVNVGAVDARVLTLLVREGLDR